MTTPKQEKPQQIGFRLYKHHRKAIKTLSKAMTKKRKEKTSESQIVREAIEAYEYANT